MCRKSFVLLIFIFLSASMQACQERVITVENAWARTGQRGSNSAVYFIIENPTDDEDSLLFALSDVSVYVEIHRSMMVEGSDAMTMQPQDLVAIPPADKIEFAPGGYHVMLIDLVDDLSTGDLFNLKLIFEYAGEIQLEVEVRDT